MLFVNFVRSVSRQQLPGSVLALRLQFKNKQFLMFNVTYKDDIDLGRKVARLTLTFSLIFQSLISNFVE